MTDIYKDAKGEFVVTLGNTPPKVISDRTKLSEYSGVDLASGFPKDQVWTTKDGRRIAIPNLTNSHLLNIIDFIRKRVKQYRMQIAVKYLAKVTAASMLFDHLRDDELEEYSEDVMKEVKKLDKIPDEDFLHMVFPIYGKLYQEAYRRKLVQNPVTGRMDVRGPKVDHAPKKPVREPTLIEQMQEFYDMTHALNGIEVHKDQWPVIDEVMKKWPNDFELTGPRGPDNAWKRLEPKIEYEEK